MPFENGAYFVLGVRIDEPDRLVNLMNRPVDVAKGALLQALGGGIILFVSDVLVSLLEQLFGAVQPAGVVQPGVNRRMIIQVFAVVDGRFLDFANGVINGVNGFLLFMAQFAAIVMFQMGARSRLT